MPPPLVTDQRPELPEALDDVISRAMSKDPDERPANATDLIDEAERAFGKRVRAVITPPAPPERPEESGIRKAEGRVPTRRSRIRKIFESRESQSGVQPTRTSAEPGDTPRPGESGRTQGAAPTAPGVAPTTAGVAPTAPGKAPSTTRSGRRPSPGWRPRRRGWHRRLRGWRPLRRELHRPRGGGADHCRLVPPRSQRLRLNPGLATRPSAVAARARPVTVSARAKPARPAPRVATPVLLAGAGLVLIMAIAGFLIGNSGGGGRRAFDAGRFRVQRRPDLGYSV